MAVTIYQNEELNDVCFEIEALDEWKKLNAELGLSNQLEFIKQAESPVPYPWINKSMDLILSTLCPSKIDFRKYDKTPIPLEVLKQISYSIKEKHFEEIQVWYDDKSPDPAAVGIIKKYYCYDESYKHMQDQNGNTMYFNSEQELRDFASTIEFKIRSTSSDVKKYLIARWADMIRPVTELKDLAKERLLEKYGSELRNEIEEKTQALKKIQENVLLYLSGDITESQLKGSRGW